MASHANFIFFNLWRVFFLGSVIMFQADLIDISGTSYTAIAWEQGRCIWAK